MPRPGPTDKSSSMKRCSRDKASSCETKPTDGTFASTDSNRARLIPSRFVNEYFWTAGLHYRERERNKAARPFSSFILTRISYQPQIGLWHIYAGQLPAHQPIRSAFLRFLEASCQLTAKRVFTSWFPFYSLPKYIFLVEGKQKKNGGARLV